MLDFKPFYVYYIRPRHHTDCAKEKRVPRGFTAKIEPSKAKHKVMVSHTYCAYKDEFVKKTGRGMVDYLPGQLVNARDLPRLLSVFETTCLPLAAASEQKYLYVLKYMV